MLCGPSLDACYVAGPQRCSSEHGLQPVEVEFATACRSSFHKPLPFHIHIGRCATGCRRKLYIAQAVAGKIASKYKGPALGHRARANSGCVLRVLVIRPMRCVQGEPD
eukprot:COSAG01_NODE_38098_length_494_cov_1.017722_1_plen_107_part_01